MPIYDFVCKSCAKKFEELVFSDDLPACVHCQSGDTERLVSRPSRPSNSARSFSATTATGDAMSGSAGSSCSGCSGSSCSSCGH